MTGASHHILSTPPLGKRAGMPRRRGTILIVTMLILFTLASVVLVLTRKMAVEQRASANQAAAVQAATIAHGAEQYAMALLNVNSMAVLDLTEDYFNGIQLGEGYFWIVRPHTIEGDLPLYGLVDECSKLDINYVTYDQLMYLPGMTDSLASSIVDWRDANEDVTNAGAESQFYLTQPMPYYAKNAPFDTVEELLMVAGMYRQYLYGDGSAAPLGTTGGISTNTSSMMTDPILARGLYDIFTVHAYAPPAEGGGGGGGGNQPARGRINVNTAPRSVLMTLLANGLEEADVDAIIGQRLTTGILGTSDISWLGQTIGNGKVNAIEDNITGQSYRYSAEIVSASRSGRAFKRIRVIMDASTNPATVVFRRDVTDQGWPLDPTILTALRAGQTPAGGNNRLGTTTGGGLR